MITLSETCLGIATVFAFIGFCNAVITLPGENSKFAFRAVFYSVVAGVFLFASLLIDWR